MSSPHRKWFLRFVCPLAGISLAFAIPRHWISPTADAENLATAPATHPANRSQDEIMSEMKTLNLRLAEVAGSIGNLVDDQKAAAEAAPKAIPLIRAMLADTDELAKLNPDYKQRFMLDELQERSMLVFFGDQPTIDQLNQEAQDKDPAKAVAAQCALLRGQWLAHGTDAAALGKVLDQMQALAKSNPTSDLACGALVDLYMQTDNFALGDRIYQTLQAMANANNPIAKEIVVELTPVQKLRALVGKPLTVAGPTATGENFTTAIWKGRVVLAVFFDSSDDVSAKALQRVAKAYADLHAKGLEVLGISSDPTPATLATFLKNHKSDMPWPTLFDAKNPDPHALARQLGIEQMPTLLLIDKQGICRGVELDNLEKQITKLLEEK